MINKYLISILYKLTSAVSSEKLIAWDFPADIFKKVYFTLEKYLATQDIPITQPEGLKGEYADWPHFSIAFIPQATSEEKIEKIKLAGPLFSSSLKAKELVLFKGRKDPSVCFLVLKLESGNPSKLEKFRSFIFDLVGIEEWDKDFVPHASIAVADIKYLEKLKELLPELQNRIRRYAVAYTPEQLQIWENFRIVDIDSLKFK